LNCWNFRTLYSRRHLDALFLITVFKGKINCHSIMDTVGIRVPIRQIREFSTLCEHCSPSARCVIAANDTCRFLGISAKTMSPLKILSPVNSFYQTTLRNNPEHSHLHPRHRKNLKSQYCIPSHFLNQQSLAISFQIHYLIIPSPDAI
jgi:hypothetical protein